jgi:hypothetical protein
MLWIERLQFRQHFKTLRVANSKAFIQQLRPMIYYILLYSTDKREAKQVIKPIQISKLVLLKRNRV